MFRVRPLYESLEQVKKNYSSNFLVSFNVSTKFLSMLGNIKIFDLDYVFSEFHGAKAPGVKAIATHSSLTSFKPNLNVTENLGAIFKNMS